MSTHPKQRLRESIRERDDNECQFCGITAEKYAESHTNGLHIHHIMPETFGGTDHPSNLITVCVKCHKVADKISRRAALTGMRQIFGRISERDGSFITPERKTVCYSVEIEDDELWQEWTNSFPREQSINDRLIELIQEDAG